jgi:hypothetical protein
MEELLQVKVDKLLRMDINLWIQYFYVFVASMSCFYLIVV